MSAEETVAAVGEPDDAERAGLRRWVEAQIPGSITRWQRTSRGGSRETYIVDVTAADGRVHPLILRAESGGSFTGTEINVSKEAAVYRALANTPVPVPRVFGLAPEGAALLMERVRGTSETAALSDGERRVIIGALVDVIADMHRVPVEHMELPGFARPHTPEEHATLDLGVWASLAARGVPDLDPLVVYAGSYLRHHPPAEVARTVLVQGDTGPGNCLFVDGEVTALIDMEFSHLGDPMDDLAWLSMRTQLSGIDISDFFERYETRSGVAVDQRSIDFYAVAVQYRCAITTSLAVARGGGAAGWAPYLLVTQRYLNGLSAALSSYLGIVEPTLQFPEASPSPRRLQYEHLLDGIGDAVRAIEDPELRQDTRNLRILVRYLGEFDAMGRDLDEADAADLRLTLALEPGNGAGLAKIAEEGGASGDETVLRYLLRRTQRIGAPWGSTLARERR